MMPKRIFTPSFDFLICTVWIMFTVTGSNVNSKEYPEIEFEFPFLTPGTYTEAISQSSLTSPTSKYMTSESTNNEVYDQILPSRDPTTPLSRRYLYKMLRKNEFPESASTLATTIHAPPPLHKHS